MCRDAKINVSEPIVQMMVVYLRADGSIGRVWRVILLPQDVLEAENVLRHMYHKTKCEKTDLVVSGVFPLHASKLRVVSSLSMTINIGMASVRAFTTADPLTKSPELSPVHAVTRCPLRSAMFNAL